MLKKGAIYTIILAITIIGTVLSTKNKLFAENIFNAELSFGYNSNVLEDETHSLGSTFNRFSVIDNYIPSKIPADFLIYAEFKKYYQNSLSDEIYINSEITFNLKYNIKEILGCSALKDNNDNTNSVDSVYNRVEYKFDKFKLKYTFQYRYYTEKYEYDNYILYKFFNKFKLPKNFFKKKKDYTMTNIKKYEKDITNNLTIDYSVKNFTISTTFETNNSNIKYEKYRATELFFENHFNIKNFHFNFSANTGYFKYYKIDKNVLTLTLHFDATYYISDKFYLGLNLESARYNSNEKYDSFTKYISYFFAGFNF